MEGVYYRQLGIGFLFSLLPSFKKQPNEICGRAKRPGDISHLYNKGKEHFPRDLNAWFYSVVKRWTDGYG